ncbi:ATP-binding protein [Streptomyces sp. NPDC005562]|uniref:ATP-binding protein n=1 Tax=Streptomyces sp. NPDC005562 TaxID=3154890 RepID=UPI0033A40CCE
MHSPLQQPPRPLGLLRHLTYTRYYAVTPESVTAVRADLREAARQACLVQDVTDTILVLLSELATNAVKHAKDDRERPRFAVSVSVLGMRRRFLHLEVHDHDHNRVPSMPDKDKAPMLLLEMDDKADSGRGLVMVAAMSDRSGVQVNRDLLTGKIVWCELTLPEPPHCDSPLQRLQERVASRTDPCVTVTPSS